MRLPLFLFVLVFALLLLVHQVGSKGGRGGGGRGGGSRGGGARSGSGRASSGRGVGGRGSSGRGIGGRGGGSRSSGGGTVSGGGRGGQGGRSGRGRIRGGSGAFGGKGWSFWGRKSSTSGRSISTGSRMNSFMAGAGVGYLSGRSTRYYYRPIGYKGSRGYESDDNVCSYEVSNKEFQKKTKEVEMKNGKVTVYFLCDGRCCGADCCDLNVDFLVFFIFVILGGIFGLICCCYCWKKKQWNRKESMETSGFDNAHNKNLLA